MTCSSFTVISPCFLHDLLPDLHQIYIQYYIDPNIIISYNPDWKPEIFVIIFIFLYIPNHRVIVSYE